ncbi:MAG: hypothetical protein WCS18_05155 [Sphaerochaetaceae bacterium]
MSCDCLKQMNEGLMENNVQIKTGEWFDLKKGTYQETVLITMVKTKPSRKHLPQVKPSFCPFCGKPYDDAKPVEKFGEKDDNALNNALKTQEATP